MIVPAHARPDLLVQAVASAQAQRPPPLEVIVVVDGPSFEPGDLPDRPAPVLRFRQPRRGAGAARNLGVREAHGDVVAFLDSDDVLLPGALAAFDQALRQGASWAMTRTMRFQGDDVPAPPARANPPIVPWPDYLAAAHEQYPVTIAVAVRREVFLASGGFAEHARCAEDQDLFLRWGTVPRFAFVDAPLYGYRVHPDSVSHDRVALYLGVRTLLRHERRGHYPGGARRRSERDVLLARNVVYAASRLTHGGAPRLALVLLLRGAGPLVRSGHARPAMRAAYQALARWSRSRAPQAARPSHFGTAGGPAARS